MNKDIVFLTAENIPPNLLRLKPGELVSPVGDTIHDVMRVGYRLHARELKDEAAALLDTPEGRRSALDMQTMCGARVELEGVVARALVQARRFGGPERGIVAQPRSANWDSIEVLRTRRVVLGTYFPGGGGWSHGPDGSEYEYDNGGLSRPRTVVLVDTIMGEFISGELRRST